MLDGKFQEILTFYRHERNSAAHYQICDSIMVKEKLKRLKLMNISAESNFDFGSAEFADLFTRADATAFQHPLWLDALHRIWAPAREAEPVTIVGRHDSGALRFVLPLLRRSLSGVVMLETTDLGVSDYAAPVVDRYWLGTLGDDGALANAVMAALPHHDMLRIRPVRPEHFPVWKAFLGGKARMLDFGAHAVTVRGPMDDWRERSLTDSFARILARKRKRFFKTPGARLEVLHDPERIADAIEQMAKWRVGRFAGDVIQHPAALALYRAVAVEGARSGFARTYALETDGEVIGLTFAITAAGRLNYLLIGCDYARFGRHSPGLLLYDGMIADWINQGGEVFDFTIGDEPFKTDFGTHRTQMSDLTRAATWRGSLALSALSLRERWRARRQSNPDKAVRASRERDDHHADAP
jgi:CelD/BcsL family acetyltransferase involved in cellulose biosynthesis